MLNFAWLCFFVFCCIITKTLQIIHLLQLHIHVFQKGKMTVTWLTISEAHFNWHSSHVDHLVVFVSFGRWQLHKSHIKKYFRCMLMLIGAQTRAVLISHLRRLQRAHWYFSASRSCPHGDLKSDICKYGLTRSVFMVQSYVMLLSNRC